MNRFKDLRARLSFHRAGNAPIGPSIGDRSAFEKDVDRILFSEPFRILADKTQVHGPSGTTYARSRLTHSIEVSRVGRTIGNRVARSLPGFENDDRPEDVGDILQAAGLLHDVGNPPFGHRGEHIISKFFLQEGKNLIASLSPRNIAEFTGFEGNAQAFRIATKLTGWRSHGGLALCAATLASFAKYPKPANEGEQKYGIFEDDLPAFEEVAHVTKMTKNGGGWNRHPLAYLSEAADDICYSVVDIEDAAAMGLISIEEAESLLVPFLKKEDRVFYESIKGRIHQLTFLRSRAISTLIEASTTRAIMCWDQLMEGTHKGNLLGETEFGQHLHAINRFSRMYIYNNGNRGIENEKAEEAIIGILSRTSKALLEREQWGIVREESILAMNDPHRIPLDRLGWLRALCDHIVAQTDHSTINLWKKLCLNEEEDKQSIFVL